MEDVEDEARDEHLATRGGRGSRAKSSQHATSSNMPKPRVSHFGGIPGSVSPESAQKHAQAWVSHFVGGRSCPKKRPRTSLGFTCSQNSWSRRKRTKTYPSLGCTFSRGFLGRSRQKNPEAHGNGPRSTVSISPRSRPHHWPRRLLRSPDFTFHARSAPPRFHISRPPAASPQISHFTSPCGLPPGFTFHARSAPPPPKNFTFHAPLRPPDFTFHALCGLPGFTFHARSPPPPRFHISRPLRPPRFHISRPLRPPPPANFTFHVPLRPPPQVSQLGPLTPQDS